MSQERVTISVPPVPVQPGNSVRLDDTARLAVQGGLERAESLSVQVASAQVPASGERKCWWCEPELIVLIALVAAAYVVRIDDLSMRGEEPRRAQVAFEILQRGDWIVPREQGEPF